jgi:hypothetical protein
VRSIVMTRRERRVCRHSVEYRMGSAAFLMCD